MNGQKKVKRTENSSVFTDLFGDSGYMLQLYQSLHPEDQDVQEGDLEIITLENIITNGVFSVLGFRKGNTLMVLAEQNTWTVNGIVLVLEALVSSYQRYFSEHALDLYGSRKVELPIPELYIIYTGERKIRLSELCLSETFFNGKTTALEVNVKVICNGRKGDVLHQYTAFTKVLAEQTELYGRSRKAVTEAIHICKNKSVPGGYLESREREVVDMMVRLYDQEEIMRVHDKRIARDSGIRNVVKALKDFGFSFSEIVNKVAEQFHLAQDRAEREVKEYWG